MSSLSEESALIAREEGYIRRLAVRYGGWGVPLEDLQQEGLLALVVGYRRWKEAGNTGAFSCHFVVTTAMRGLVGRVRSADGSRTLRRREDHRSLDAPHPTCPELSLHDLIGEPATQEEDLLVAEQRQIAAEALAELRPRDRDLLTMRAVEELDLKQTGARLGISGQRAGVCEQDAIKRLCQAAARRIA